MALSKNDKEDIRLIVRDELSKTREDLIKIKSVWAFIVVISSWAIAYFTKK